MNRAKLETMTTVVDAAVRRPRGAALILAMLLLLVLSALGLVALRSVNDSIVQAGNYRIRTQANQFSDTLTSLAANRLGNHAHAYFDAMESQLRTELAEETDATRRRDLVRRGGYRVFSNDATPAAIDPVTGALEGDQAELSLDYLFADGGGMFHNPSGGGSFENEYAGANAPSYSFILRDPLDGPPAVGFDRSHCFKKVTIASEAQLGNKADGWDVRNNFAQSRHIMEAIIGPVPCGTE